MMQGQDVARASVIALPRGAQSICDGILLRIASRALQDMGQGRLHLTMPSGRALCVGKGSTVEASLSLRSLKPIWRSIARGGLGFAESYMRGEVETADLGNLIRLYIDNYDSLAARGKGLFEVRATDKLWHRRRANTREGSQRNIAAHYDLGNDFYAAWLDPGMTYSSALYTRPDLTLEEAQEAKYARILAGLDIKPGHMVLEIGCGWGGMAERAAGAGADVTAITVSKEQHDYAAARLAAAGLDDTARVVFRDYRDVDGSFDRIVSIEMIEAVGEEHWPTYFATLAKSLKPGGSAVIQAITIREQDFALYRSRPDFIQRYIFPGGMLPTTSGMREDAERTGLAFETVERFGASYALTLAEWRKRFLAAWHRIAPLGFDDRFRRMWEYYLTYCEVGFERGVVDVGLYRLHKPA